MLPAIAPYNSKPYKNVSLRNSLLSNKNDFPLVKFVFAKFLGMKYPEIFSKGKNFF